MGGNPRSRVAGSKDLCIWNFNWCCRLPFRNAVIYQQWIRKPFPSLQPAISNLGVWWVWSATLICISLTPLLLVGDLQGTQAFIFSASTDPHSIAAIQVKSPFKMRHFRWGLSKDTLLVSGGGRIRTQVSMAPHSANPIWTWWFLQICRREKMAYGRLLLLRNPTQPRGFKVGPQWIFTSQEALALVVKRSWGVFFLGRGKWWPDLLEVKGGTTQPQISAGTK